MRSEYGAIDPGGDVSRPGPLFKTPDRNASPANTDGNPKPTPLGDRERKQNPSHVIGDKSTPRWRDIYPDTGGKQDKAEAFKWYQKAAAQGDSTAQYNIGYSYNNGEGVDIDHAEAVKWYRKAAEQGYDLAQYNLGLMYMDGEGVKQDYAMALHWYTKAAQQGNPLAQLNLGNMYLHGNGIKFDYQAAYYLLKQSAMQGELLAIYNIGQMHTIGAEVQQSNVLAFAHYQIARSLKDRDIDEDYNTLKSQMTPAEIQAGEQEARKLRREYGVGD